MSRAFVTGITGQDGSYLSERLIADGWEVHALVRPGSLIGEQPVMSQVVGHEGDLGDTARLRSVVAEVAPDVIFNLGGLTSVALSWEQPEIAAEVSGVAPLVLLDAAWSLHEQGLPVRVVQASSAEIFGAAELSPQDENTPVRPLNPYGAAKAFAQHSVGIYRARGLFAASAILYNHESPRRPETFVTRKITAGAARIALGKQDELILGNLSVRRDWGWAPDYVDAMLRIADADRPQDFVIATGEAHSIGDFVEAAFLAAGVADWESRVGVDSRFGRPIEALESRGNSARAQRELGWRPSVRFEELVARMVQSDLEEFGTR